MRDAVGCGMMDAGAVCFSKLSGVGVDYIRLTTYAK